MHKSARQVVIEEAFPDDERLRSIASQEATYVGNCVGGRPSDSARTAVRYVAQAISLRKPSALASPAAQRMMNTYLMGKGV